LLSPVFTCVWIDKVGLSKLFALHTRKQGRPGLKFGDVKALLFLLKNVSAPTATLRHAVFISTTAGSALRFSVKSVSGPRRRISPDGKVKPDTGARTVAAHSFDGKRTDSANAPSSACATAIPQAKPTANTNRSLSDSTAPANSTLRKPLHSKPHSGPVLTSLRSRLHRLSAFHRFFDRSDSSLRISCSACFQSWAFCPSWRPRCSYRW